MDGALQRIESRAPTFTTAGWGGTAAVGSRADEEHKLRHYKDPAVAMLSIAAFAAAITFTIVLTPRDDPLTSPGLVELAYANSLFCGSIVGCIYVIIGVELCIFQRRRRGEVEAKRAEAERMVNDTRNGLTELERAWIRAVYIRTHDLLVIFDRWLSVIVQISTAFAGITLYVAFFLMLYATRQYLKYDGPFVLGSALYLSLGPITLVTWIWSLVLEGKVGQKAIARELAKTQTPYLPEGKATSPV